MPAVRDVWERGDDPDRPGVRALERHVVRRRVGGPQGRDEAPHEVERIALLTDLDWMITVTSLFGWMTPGELKRFPVAERDQAIAWVAGDG